MFKFVKKYLFTFIIFIIMFFSLGFFGCEYIYNNLKAEYVYQFTASDDPKELLSVEFFDESIKILEENKIAYANIDYEKMLKTAYINECDGYYEIVVKKSFFPDVLRKTGTVNESINRCNKYLTLILSNSDLGISFIDIKLNNYFNPFIAGSIGLGVGLIVLITLILVAYYKDKEIKDISDNESIFKHPFNKKYWVHARGFFSSVKNISTISILFAFMMICKIIPFLSGFGSLKIGITYLVFSVITMIYGPLCGIVIGLLSDIVGFIMDGGGIFFFGYTLDAMLAGVIYGICFYRTKITFTKCLTARIFVNFFINVFLGSIWWSMIYKLSYDEMIIYITVTSLPKNLLYLVPQSILLYIVLKAVAKPIARFGLISNVISDNISLF